jgi:hypothetical protein
MKYYEPIGGESIIDMINNICNTTNQSYPNKEKVMNINKGLDEYWFIATNSAPRGSVDDTNNSAISIQTTNIVAGTNGYKISDFTDNVLNILKVSVLTDDGIENDLEYQEFEDIYEFNEEYSTDTADRGNPAYWTKIGDFIYLAPCPNYSETNGLRVYVDRALDKLTYTSFTLTIATPGVATATAHGLSNSDGLLLMTDGALPTGLTTESTIYYVSGKATDTFKLSTTPGLVGTTEITTSGTQSGTHKFVKVSGEPGIPVIHHDYLARYASYCFMDQAHPQFAKIAQKIAQDKMDIQDYWEKQNRLSNSVIRPAGRAYK